MDTLKKEMETNTKKEVLIKYAKLKLILNY